ncbi:MAG: DUF4190 domain-containing protein [Frankiaceae bacterium]|jgi:hypothetical protein|nr:DUF4190 domain-containing protein [Frankiaceae bacterium]
MPGAAQGAAAFGQPAPSGQPSPYGNPNPYSQPNPYGQPGPQGPSAPFGQPVPYGPGAPYGTVGGLPHYPAGNRGRGLAIASMVLGIASVVLFIAFFLAGPAAIVGLILGIVGLRRMTAPGASRNGMGFAITGIVLSLIGVLLGTIMTVTVVTMIRDCSPAGPIGSDAWTQCIDDKSNSN